MDSLRLYFQLFCHLLLGLLSFIPAVLLLLILSLYTFIYLWQISYRLCSLLRKKRTITFKRAGLNTILFFDNNSNRRVLHKFWESLIKGMIDSYDELNGEGCFPVLALLDEFGRTKFPNMPDHATTVCGRGISLVMAFQSDSQLDALYGHDGASVLRGNMDTQIYYRPNDPKTAENLERRLGFTSGWAVSESEHEGTRDTTGKSETRVPLLTAREIMQLPDETIIGFHRGLPPFKARRMSWLNFPEFIKRQRVAPPEIPELSPVKESPIQTQETLPTAPAWQLSPDLTRRGRPVYSGRGE